MANAKPERSVTLLALDKIRTDGGTQARAGISEDNVMDLVEILRSDRGPLDPITVFRDGKTYWLADGFHRVEAHRRTSTPQINAIVREGTQRDARLYAFSANIRHGLKPSREDRRRAVLAMLEDPEWSKWSDREIARRAGVSPSTVAALRPAVSVQVGQIAGTRTVERNGKVYEQNTANIGKRAAAQPTATVEETDPLDEDVPPDESDDAPEPWQPTPVQRALADRPEVRLGHMSPELAASEVITTVRGWGDWLRGRLAGMSPDLRRSVVTKCEDAMLSHVGAIKELMLSSSDETAAKARAAFGVIPGGRK